MPWKLGDYLLLERLNQGGMADVYLAKTFGFSGADQTLAVKCIRPEVGEDPDFVSMFVDEAKLSVLLDHASIAQTYELGRIGTVYFMALEYVPGRDLRAVIDRALARGLDLPLAAALQIAIRVCEALDYAHRKADPTGVPLHIVHRDVSPQNVLVSYDGGVKVIDFGIAKAATQASRSQAGILKGKYGYMSPEQVQGMAVDARSDVFATGVLLFELLTRQRLFPGSSDFSVLEKVRHAEVYPPTAVVPSLPAQIERVVLRALSLDPERRFPSASDMGDALVRVMLEHCGPPKTRDLSTLMRTLFEEEQKSDLDRLERSRQLAEMPKEVEDLLAATEAPAAPSMPAHSIAAADASLPGRASDTVRAAAPAPETTARLAPSPGDPAREMAKTKPRRPPAPARALSPARTGGENRALTGSAGAMARPAGRLPPFLGLDVLPPQLRSAFKSRDARRWRDVLIIGVAFAVAGALVFATWLATRTTDPDGRGGIVVITDPADAEVMLDGVRVGVTPYSTSLPVGSRTLAIRKPGYASESREVQIDAQRVVEVRVKLSRGR